ncbi:proline dehydrogenase family protein [bacterium]|nr:proline dehydrogenase family protein [bacterium]
MPIMKNLLLWCSRNQWMSHRFPRFKFVQRAVKRFMPGEDLSSALAVSRSFQSRGISTVLTCLGENINDLSEAEKVRDHYLAVLDQIAETKLPTEISVKLTQLGFDIDLEKTKTYFRQIAKKAVEQNNFVWIDIESSGYVDATIAFFKTMYAEFSNVGLCLQAYLYRTEKDWNELKNSPGIRLVKGAYRESAAVAFPAKKDVDTNYLKLALQMIETAQNGKFRPGIATHDMKIVNAIKQTVAEKKWNPATIEFQMLYGINEDGQTILTREGYKMRVLISYGSAWFPWYMRRLAERPANVWFVIKSIFR